MSASSNNSPVDQQYLKALGIDLWVPREFEVVAPADTVPVVQDSAAKPEATAVPQQANKPLCDWSAAELTSLLPGLKVLSLKAGTGVELLVVTDSPVPVDECNTLLGSMLKAIKVSTSQWATATIVEDAPETLQAVAATADPQAILLMLRTKGNASALDRLRGQQYQVSALNTFAAVSFHPQDLLDNPDLKRPAWEDLKQLRQWLG